MKPFIHKNRPFNQSAFNKFDPKGKSILKEFLSQRFSATNFVDNDESFFSDNYFDFSCEIQGISCKFEVEFSDKRFIYSTCHVPHRKYKNKANYICCVNEKYIWICEKSLVLDSKIIEIPIGIRHEQFFDCNWKKGRFSEKVNSKWTPLRRASRI